MHSTMTFGASLSAFMKARGLSIAALARLTGEKSATTISRLIHDQSTPKRCAAFLQTLQAVFPDMAPEEKDLLQRGLSLSRTGTDDTKAQYALAQLLHGTDAPPVPSPLSSLLLSHADADAFDLYCIQGTDSVVLDALALLLAGSDQRVHVHHFISAPLPEGIASFAARTSRILCDSRYTLHYLPDVSAAPLTWYRGNAMLLRTQRNLADQQLLILAQADGQVKSLPLESVDLLGFMQSVCAPHPAQAEQITASYELNTPRNGLAYLSRCYDREVGRPCYLLRSRPNLAMVPVALMQILYNDATELQQTSVKDYALELRRICYLRYANRVEKDLPAYVIFSLQGLKDFVRNGMLLDHFRSLRPFTPAERRQILTHLIHQAETIPGMHLHVARDESLFRGLIFSCYEGGGVLAAPVPDRYLSPSAGNRPFGEAFFRDPAFTRQFQDYYLHTLLPRFACSEEESLSVLRALADSCGDA